MTLPTLSLDILHCIHKACDFSMESRSEETSDYAILLHSHSTVSPTFHMIQDVVARALPMRSLDEKAICTIEDRSFRWAENMEVDAFYTCTKCHIVVIAKFTAILPCDVSLIKGISISSITGDMMELGSFQMGETHESSIRLQTLGPNPCAALTLHCAHAGSE